MSFWTWLTGEPSGNTNSPGDPDGVNLEGFDDSTETRALPKVLPSAWAGWPADWGVPNWDFGSRFNELIDIAWTCLDLNSNVLSAMPAYRTRNGETVDPASWMGNPDPSVYSSWEEFAKQLFWDYQLGEVFVLSMARFSDGFPMTFRVVPPWLIHPEISGGGRSYRLGGVGGTDVTDDILHIRYKSTTGDARGVGPLESAGGRMLTAGVLAKYVREVVGHGGLVNQTLETDAQLEPEEAEDIKSQWMAKRMQDLAAPPLLDGGVKLQNHFHMKPRDLAMVEISNFTEARIAVLLGTPPFLVGLPMTSGEDSMTYSNATSLFDFHDRAWLRPKAAHVMSALSNWVLPRGQRVELNRDEYTRPAFNERADAWVKLVKAGIVSPDEARQAERFTGDAPGAALTGIQGETTAEPRSNGHARTVAFTGGES